MITNAYTDYVVNILILVPFVEASWNYIIAQWLSSNTIALCTCMHFALPSDLVLLPPSVGEPFPCALGPSYPPLRWRHWLWPQHSPWQEIHEKSLCSVFFFSDVLGWEKTSVLVLMPDDAGKSNADLGLHSKKLKRAIWLFYKFKVTSGWIQGQELLLAIEWEKLGLNMQKLGWSRGSRHSLFWVCNMALRPALFGAVRRLSPKLLPPLS